jgi:hypothetical protein
MIVPMLAEEKIEKTEPAEPTDRIEPSEPIDKIEPAEPIDSTEPTEPIDKIEPAEPIDSTDRCEPIESGPVTAAPMSAFSQRYRIRTSAAGDPVGQPTHGATEPSFAVRWTYRDWDLGSPARAGMYCKLGGCIAWTMAGRGPPAPRS